MPHRKIDGVRTGPFPAEAGPTNSMRPAAKMMGFALALSRLKPVLLKAGRALSGTGKNFSGKLAHHEYL